MSLSSVRSLKPPKAVIVEVLGVVGVVYHPKNFNMFMVTSMMARMSCMTMSFFKIPEGKLLA